MLGLAVPYDGDLTCEHLDSLTPGAYRCGQVWGITIEVAGVRFYHQGSANLIDDAVRERDIDVFLAGVAGRSFTEDYWKRILPRLDPKVVVPTHYDNFFRPLGQQLEFVSNVQLSRLPEEIGAVSADARIAASPARISLQIHDIVRTIRAGGSRSVDVCCHFTRLTFANCWIPAVTAVSVGGAMAYTSGYFASRAISKGRSPEVLGGGCQGRVQRWGWPGIPGGTYHWGMDLMEWLLKTSWGASTLSAIVSLLAGVASPSASNAPPALFILALVGGMTAYIEPVVFPDRSAKPLDCWATM